MFVGLEKHLTQLGWDFVVTTSFSIWGDKHGIFFCIKCFGDIFCVILVLYKKIVNVMGH
jgi:hypothetical protein